MFWFNTYIFEEIVALKVSIEPLIAIDCGRQLHSDIMRGKD